MDNNQTKIWERANVFYQSTRKPLNLLIASNADAAAASATIMSLLKASLIPFQAHPIANQDELTDMIHEANLGQEVARLDPAAPFVDDFFLLIGLGATLHLTNLFDLSRHVVVVLDALRPVHLENLRREDGDRLTLWGSPRIRDEVETFFRDQRQQEATRRRRQRRKADRKQQKRLRRRYQQTGRTSVDPDDGDDDETLHGRHHAHDDGDDDSISSTGSPEKGQADRHGRRARRLESDAGDADLSSDDEDDEDNDSIDSESDLISDTDDNEPYVAGFSSQEDPQVHWSERVELDEDGVMAEDPVSPPLQILYYSSECAGKSCALEAYELAVLLNRLKTPMLWHAAVGVCDLFLRRLIDYGTYLVEMQQIHDAVSLRRQTSQHALEAYTADAANAISDGASGSSGSASAQLQARAASNAMQLSNVDEELLYLLRHLSLWEAIWHHPVIASVLRLHHVEDGEGFLSQLLASRCGVSRERAQQPWRELPQEVRQDCLPRVQSELQRLLEQAAGFVKHTTQLRCVARAVGYSTEVSSFDACHLFEAVLSATPPASLFVVEGSDLASIAEALERAGRGGAAGKSPLELGREVVRSRLRDFHRQRFWLAHAVIDVDPNEKIFRGAVQDAVELQNCIADATGALMQPGLLQSTRGVHYVLPQEALKTTSALESFLSVPRLEALGTRLLYTLGVERRRAHVWTVRPLLLSAAVPEPVLRLREDGGGNSSRTSALGGAGAAPSAGGVLSAQRLSSSRGLARDENAYLVLLVHQGAVRGGLTPVPAVGRFLSCIEDEEEFAAGLPDRVFMDRRVVLVKGREVATHVIELMHLRSLDRWDPRAEYATRQAELEEAQQQLSFKNGLETNYVADSDDDDGEDGHHNTHDSTVGLLA